MVSGKRLRDEEDGGAIRKAVISSVGVGLLQISVPMDKPLRLVNSYLLYDETDRVTIIDPGPHSLETELAWEDTLYRLDLSWAQIQQVVVTHHHPDHYGLAGWIQERSSCEVWMSERAHAEALLMWGDDSRMNEALPLMFSQHGMPEHFIKEIKGHLEYFKPQVTPQPNVSYITAFEPFKMGHCMWLPIFTGGHAPGHVSFFNSENGYMICGDAVLPQISPNVSLLPGSDPEPLQIFLEGLRELGGYEVSLAFPGHREPFTGFANRVDSLLLHHEERLNAAEALLADGPLSGFELCEVLFRGRVSSIHQMRFALSETLAHMVELIRRGRAVQIERDHGFVFSSAK